MNKVIATLAMCLATTGLFAQDGKPTQAQTIEYLQANYPNSLDYVASVGLSGNERLTFEGEIRDLSLRIAGTQVTASYVDILERTYLKDTGAEEDEERTQHVIVFDLKDIEAIEGLTPAMLGELFWEDVQIGSFPMYLLFKTANGKDTVTATVNGETRKVAAARIPFALDGRRDNHQVLSEFKSTQLYKAFEHLRKLSGAPEPLRF